jgi:hypothetical protein
MERGSSHHAPRIDDELAAESAPMLHGATLSARDREDLEPEVPAADEEGASPEVLVSDAEPDVPAHDEVLARSELARWLLPSSFPARAATLAAVAAKQGAPGDVVSSLEGIADTRIFETVGELWTALGGTTEQRTPAEPEVEPTATREPDALQPVVEAVLDATDDFEPAPSNTVDPTDAPVVVAAIAPTGASPIPEAPSSTTEPEAPSSTTETVVRLVTLPPRIALAAVRGISHVVGRSIAAVTGSDSDHPSS